MGEKLLPSVCLIACASILSSCGVTEAGSRDIPAIATFFNTKSRYEEANPYLLDDILFVNSSAVKPPAPACTAVHLSAIIRHGTRYPTSGNIKKIGKFHHLVTTTGSGGLLPELTAWKMWYKEEMDGRLVDKGRSDHRHLAQRLAKSFPSLFTKESLQGGQVKFITSSKHRCVNSTLAFQQGLKEMLGTEGKVFRNSRSFSSNSYIVILRIKMSSKKSYNPPPLFILTVDLLECAAIVLCCRLCGRTIVQ